MHQADTGERPAPCCCSTAHFTEREVDVLTQVAAGLTNGEVAAALGISGNTVAAHLREMLTRSNVRSRAALVAWAYAVGVLAPYTWPPRWSGRRCLQLPPAAGVADSLARKVAAVPYTTASQCR
jgi:DNA-binding CsgD family transcriptional regulator